MQKLADRGLEGLPGYAPQYHHLFSLHLKENPILADA
jgi:hypothetical protein